jgi:hypothetical protein
MKFETNPYFHVSRDRYGFPNSDIASYFEPPPNRTLVSFSLPPERSRTLYFCNRLLDAASPQSDLLMLPTAWGIWPSSENRHLYDALRNKPCHCFSPDERQRALDFIYLAVLFSWDFYLLPNPKELIFVSHDEDGAFYCPDRYDEVSDALEEFE